jgi:hypothetical protein
MLFTRIPVHLPECFEVYHMHACAHTCTHTTPPCACEMYVYFYLFAKYILCVMSENFEVKIPNSLCSLSLEEVMKYELCVSSGYLNQRWLG